MKKCLETRTTPDGFTRRRYASDDGRRWTTIEVPIEVWRGVNRQGRAHDRAAQWGRARQRDALRVRAVSLAADNWRTLAIASELQLPVRTVNRWLAAAGTTAKERARRESAAA